MDEETFRKVLRNGFVLREQAFAEVGQISRGRKALDCADQLLNCDDKLTGSQLLEVLVEFTPLAIACGDFSRASTYVAMLVQISQENTHMCHLAYTAWIFNGMVLLGQGRGVEAVDSLNRSSLPLSPDGSLLVPSKRLLNFLRELLHSEAALMAHSREAVVGFVSRLVEGIKDEPGRPNKQNFLLFLEELQGS